MKTNLRFPLALAAAAMCVVASALAAPQEDAAMSKNGQPMTQAAAAAPAPATDSDTKSAAQTKFDALDANHDGYIDKQEASVSKPLQDEFASIDANKDNKLSLIEFQNVKDLASIKVKPSSDAYR